MKKRLPRNSAAEAVKTFFQVLNGLALVELSKLEKEISMSTIITKRQFPNYHKYEMELA